MSISPLALPSDAAPDLDSDLDPDPDPGAGADDRPKHLGLGLGPGPAGALSRVGPSSVAPASNGAPGAGLVLPVASQLPSGRLIELSGERGGCQMTQAVACLKHAQHRGETTAWVQLEGGSLFPPDLADSGIDLSALIVVHVPRPARHAGLAKAAELLLRSGGFGMVVLDLWGTPLDARTAWQGRLLGMAREHGSWVVLLGQPAHGSPGNRTHRTGRAERAHPHALGPLVSIRLGAARRRIDSGRFAVTPRVLKDKSGSLGALAEEHRRGPWGLL